MNRHHLAAGLLLAACGTSGIPHPKAADRHGRPALIRAEDRLADRPLTTVSRGAWAYRQPLRDEAPAGAAEAREAWTATAPAGAPTPAAPGTPAVRTGSDDFYLGASRATPGTSLTTRASGPLRAGATDDNLALPAFLEYLAASRAQHAGAFVDLDVTGACHLRVVDRSGAPVPGAWVQVVDEARDRIVWRGTTYGDGRVPFFPAVARLDGGNGLAYVVEAEAMGERIREPWNGLGNLDLRLPKARPDAEVMALDVCFVIDTTGSMQDEIDAIKATLLQVTARLRALGTEFDLRYGAVLYRDLGDDYVTAQHAFTKDITAFDAALREVRADGGGDYPESLNQGLAVAVDGMDWRPAAAKVAFLIADAPPHLDYQGDVLYDQSLRAAVATGIRIHSVAASGLEGAGSVVFRQIAQWTRGEFVFLEYGGDVGSSGAAHGVTATGTGNNLDEILFTRIRDEIARWGR